MDHLTVTRRSSNGRAWPWRDDGRRLPPGSAVAAGRVSARMIRTGEMLDDVDVLLAGIALDRDESLVTRDADDFAQVPDLKVVTY